MLPSMAGKKERECAVSSDKARTIEKSYGGGGGQVP